MGCLDDDGQALHRYQDRDHDAERMRVNHACGGGGVLVGPVNRRTRPWSILYARSPGTNGGHAKLTRVGITDAWW